MGVWCLTSLVFSSWQTIGAAFVAKPIQVGEKVITLGIWVSQMYSLEPLHIFSRSPQDLQFSLTFSSTRPRKPRPFTQNEKYLYLKIIFFIFIYFFTIVQGKCGLEIWSQSHTNILTLNVESNLNNEWRYLLSYIVCWKVCISLLTICSLIRQMCVRKMCEKISN